MTHHRDLFSPRQTVLLTTLAGLVREARAQAFVAAGGASELSARGDTRSLEEGGSGPAAYADAVALVLACAIGRTADFGATLCVWSPAPKNEVAMHVFGRQTLSMTWDYAEVNPFSESSGNWLGAVDWSAKAVERLWGTAPAQVMQADAATATSITDGYVVSTDPPYYDNVPYADLSDFFYIWTRRALQDRFPSLCRTVLVPKDAELIAEPFRHGGRQQAEAFFMDGMRNVLRRLRRGATPSAPATLYYAFKQAESTGEGAASTGWEAFLDAVLDAGFTLDGTWPVRTERPGRLRDTGSNALASSIVLVCRPRLDDAAVTTRGDFRRVLRKELPDALADLQQGNIAPVDVAQASIGPGMAVFSRYAKVLEADGAAMSVRSALQLINEVLDEYLASSEGDFDADTRFAITWYEQHGWENGPFGEAETLAKARNVSVRGVEEAGICKGGGGKVRILKRHELRPVDYDPAADTTPTIWEFTQHLIRYLEEEGEEAAARLLKKLGSSGDTAKELAYRLYNTCERKKWAEDARSYNGLILAWPELEKLAATLGDEAPGAAPSKAAKKAAKKPKAPKAQRDLFAGDDE